MQSYSRDNPFVANLRGEFTEDFLIDEQPISVFIEEMREVNRMRWQFMLLLQIIFIPFQLLIPKRKYKSNPYNTEDEPYIEIERRKSANAWMRELYDIARYNVKYHMMPKTAIIKIDDII